VKKARFFIIAFGCVTGLIAALLLWPREREPEYNGVRLSTWLERAGNGHSEGFGEAIKHVGTNALPVLVRAVAYEPPRWRFWLSFKIFQLSPRTLNSRFGAWVLNDKAERKADAALVALGILGPEARPALNDLRRLGNTRATEAILMLTGSRPGDFGPGQARF
jgi:hypothetical protein